MDSSIASIILAPRMAMGVTNRPIFRRSVIVVFHPYLRALSSQSIPARAPNVVKLAPRFEPITSEYPIAVFKVDDSPACWIIDSIMAVMGILFTRLHMKADKRATENVSTKIFPLNPKNNISPILLFIPLTSRLFTTIKSPITKITTFHDIPFSLCEILFSDTNRIRAPTQATIDIGIL